MPDPNKWEDWNIERDRFKARKSEGLIPDTRALETHIRKLQHICPKDQEKFPVLPALNMINKLQKEYLEAITLHNQIKDENPSPSD